VSAGIGALIAHVTFWVLLAYGWLADELGARGVVIFVALWVAGWFGLDLVPFGGDLFFSYVALLDVVLVFVIFKGDLRVT
jgi:hypothetical protein